MIIEARVGPPSENRPKTAYHSLLYDRWVTAFVFVVSIGDDKNNRWKSWFPRAFTLRGADNLIQLFAERHQASADAEIISYFNAYMVPATREILQSLRQANARIEELERDSS